jgi:hypothetical protein
MPATGHELDDERRDGKTTGVYRAAIIVFKAAKTRVKDSSRAALEWVGKPPIRKSKKRSSRRPSA